MNKGSDKRKDTGEAESPERPKPVDFIRKIVMDDLKAGKNGGRVVTRFPPEPNGYLHIGHAKSVCLNFGLAREFQGVCHLRFDDTNPCKEEDEYVEAIKRDVQWLGFDWGDRLFYTSDYFERLYAFARELIQKGLAYVCSLNPEDIRAYRGTLTEPGRDSPFRSRSVDENLELFDRMRKGAFNEGEHVLRAKIDMMSPNLNMRDPTVYRIRKVPHHRTGTDWCIYPMYDFSHCLSDALEGITHSICTLEFEDHRPLYDWFLDHLEVPCHPQQIEFARLNLSYTVMSKRKLLELVDGGFVSGWDDPRMPTLSGMRRRGIPAEAIRNFCSEIGVAKVEGMSDIALLEHHIRDTLNRTAPRRMGVLNPLKVVITNYSEGQVELLEAVNNPEDPGSGTRELPFSRELYIEQDDFMEDPPKKFFRLALGREVRLRYAYFIRCEEIVKDEATGEVKELRCTYDPQTRGGNAPDGRKVKSTIHWVSAGQSVKARVRVYDRLFHRENPSAEKGGADFKDHLNPASAVTLDPCWCEPSLRSQKPLEPFQFERLGYFCVDPGSSGDNLLINRTVPLRDSWAKISGRK